MNSILPVSALLMITVVLAYGADPAPTPVQLQFIQPDSVQEDFLGNVKTIDVKTYKATKGIKGELTESEHDTYTAQGCSLEKSAWDENGTLKRKEIFYYDSQGNFLRKENLSGSETAPLVSKKTFDANARTVTVETKTPDGALKEKEVTVFDNFGKEHDVVHYDASGTMTGHTTMQRNAQGKEVTVTFYKEDEQVKSRIDITWNADGSQASQTFSNPTDGTTIQVSKDYPAHDSHGNWMTRVENTSFLKGSDQIGSSQELTERQITYY